MVFSQSQLVTSGSVHGIGGTLKEIFKDQEGSFVAVMAQLTKDENLVLNGREYQTKNNPVLSTLIMNKWLADQEASNTLLWKIFNFEDKLADTINSAAA